MNAKLFACLLGLALLVGLVLYLVAGDRSATARGSSADHVPARPVEAQATIEQSERTPDLASSEPAREVAAPVAAAVSSGSWRAELAGLIGRVVESDGTPVPGMHVSLLEVDATLLFDGSGLDEEEPKIELEETMTDDEGRFVLGGARAPAFHGLGIDLGGPRATIRVVDHALRHRERTDLGDVVLAPYGIVTGRVVDESGAAVAGARVRLVPFPKEILQGQPHEFRSDSLISVDLRMLGGSGHEIIDLPKRVRDLIDRLPVPTTYSDPTGAFRLEGVAIATVVGGVDKRGWVGAPLGPIEVTGGEKDLGDVVVRHGRTVHGVIEDSSGEAAAGVDVFAGAEVVPGVVAILQPCGKSDADGQFELSGVAETGQVVAAARRSPHEPWSTAVTANHANVLVEIEDLVQLTVDVRDAQGQPLAGARILLTPTRKRENQLGFVDALAFLPHAPSPAEVFHETEPGKYVTSKLGAGPYDVVARAAGLAPGYAHVDCLAPLNEVTVTCTQGNLLELTVIDGTVKSPIAGARASILRVGDGGFTKLALVSTDADGRALLGPLPSANAPQPEASFLPSETLVLVQHPRYADHSAELELGISQLSVELTAGGSLAGKVHWGGATPTRLYMLTLEYQGADGFLEAFHVPQFVVTDLAGEFRVANLVPGEYRAELFERVLHQDPLGMMNDDFSVPTLHQEAFTIRDGETTELVIDLGPTGRGPTARVVGRVRVDGRNLEGAEVRVRGNESLKVLTDGTGRFETPAFSIFGSSWVTIEGDVKLAGRSRHMQLHNESLTLEPDDVHEIELDLYPMALPVRVVDPSGRPVPEAKVSAASQREKTSFREDETTTSSTGEAELFILEPGDYVVTASASGFSRTSTPVNVPAAGLSEPASVRLARSVPCAGHVVVPAGTGDSRGYLHVQGVGIPSSAGAMITAPDYAFSLEGLSEGEYTARIYLGGRSNAEAQIKLGPDGNDRLVVDFVPEDEGPDED